MPVNYQPNFSFQNPELIQANTQEYKIIWAGLRLIVPEKWLPRKVFKDMVILGEADQPELVVKSSTAGSLSVDREFKAFAKSWCKHCPTEIETANPTVSMSGADRSGLKYQFYKTVKDDFIKTESGVFLHSQKLKRNYSVHFVNNPGGAGRRILERLSAETEQVRWKIADLDIALPLTFDSKYFVRKNGKTSFSFQGTGISFNLLRLVPANIMLADKTVEEWLTVHLQDSKIKSPPRMLLISTEHRHTVHTQNLAPKLFGIKIPFTRGRWIYVRHSRKKNALYILTLTLRAKTSEEAAQMIDRYDLLQEKKDN